MDDEYPTDTDDSMDEDKDDDSTKDYSSDNDSMDDEYPTDTDDSMDEDKDDDSTNDYSSDNESINEDNDLNESTDDESSSYSVNDHSRVKRRRKMAKLKAGSNMLTKTLRSIEKHLKNQASQLDDCFDLFSSYELKTDYFMMLDNYFQARGLQLDSILSNKEQSFFNLVLKTDNLLILCKLMNENFLLLKSIGKKCHMAITS